MTESDIQERLRRRIIAYAALGILVIGLIVSLVSIIPLSTRLKQEQHRKLSHAVALQTLAIEEYVTRIKDIALQVTSRTQIRKKLEQYNGGTVSLAELIDFSRDKLADAMKLSDEAVGITRLGRGRQDLITVGLPLPRDRSGRPLPRRGIRDVIISDAFRRGTDYYVMAGANILSDDGRHEGTDIVLFKTGRLGRIIAGHRGLGATAATFIGKSAQGRVRQIASTNIADVFGGAELAEASPVGRALLQALNGRSGLETVAAETGEGMIIAYGPISGATWGIAVTMSAAELYAPVNRQLALISSIIVALILLGTMGVMWLIRPLTEELRTQSAGRKAAEEEKEKLQLQFVQAQKLESVARLAGGVAHDFNNLLTAILGYSKVALGTLPDQHPARDPIMTIEEAGKRGSSLVRQLLAFSRQQRLSMTPMDINAVVENMGVMLDTLSGQDVRLNIRKGEDLALVLADAGQIEQVLMNFAVNARDAMVRGGALTIETRNIAVDERSTDTRRGVQPGRYVMISVSDTGEGMTADVQERLFEPFFTTKEPGKGTGLGLATVYGIVKQHHGYIYCTSSPGRGTTFDIYLPALPAPTVDAQKGEQGAAEAILVVEDDAAVRRMVGGVLSQLGYQVLVAQDAAGARSLEGHFKGTIDLLLTERDLPDGSGADLARELSVRRPSLKALYFAGGGEAVKESVEACIEKPLIQSTLARKVRMALDATLEKRT